MGVGVGGLGAPAAATLANAGAAMTLFDPDRVELSNLPRQPLYGHGDLGATKVESAAKRLRVAHPRLDVEVQEVRIDRENAAGLLREHHAVVDATDGLEAKALLNDVALELGIPLVHAGAVGLDGQLMTILPHRTACLRCLFVELPEQDELPTCQQSGILGPVVGAVGLAAAREALRILEGRPPPLEGRLGILDGTSLRWRTLELSRNPKCPVCAAVGGAN